MKRILFALLVSSVAHAQQVPSKSAVQALSQGDVRIIAQWMIGQTFRASTTLVHVQPLALFSITPQLPTTMTVGQTLCPVAVGRDSLGGFVTGVPIKWSSSDTTVIKIGPSSLACPMSDTTIRAPRF